MKSDPGPAHPDAKDWTWVLSEPCPECGFDAGAMTGEDVAPLVLAAIGRWQSVLGRSDAAQRPTVQIWSPMEYGCHVRDVFKIFSRRATLMLAEDDPMFANWDQDQTAAEARYWDQDPDEVSAELAAAGTEVASVFAAVPPQAWNRTGRRSNGSVFTVNSLGRYFAHDVVHHLWDVAG
jgi:Mycothiol maleylpyruvate isomerase N-terminal domain